MGYHPTPKLVHEWASSLELILQYIKGSKTEPLMLSVSDPKMLYRMQYTLRRALKAANVFIDEKGGRYAGLDKHIKIGVDDEESCIVITRTAQPSIELQENTRDEKDVLKLLDMQPRSKGTFLEWFHPSPGFSEKSFREEVAARGWTLHALIPDEEDDRIMAINCVREAKQKSQSAMARLGFNRGSEE